MATRARITAPRSYEDFQPASNLVQEEDRETLIVDLPGFRKEQIRVQMDDRSGTVMTSGERPLGNNKWSRFRKDLRVPEKCNTNEIQAKFENGVLRITMPIKADYVKQEAFVPKTDQTPLSQMPKPIPPPPPPPNQKPIIAPKPTVAPLPPPPLPQSQKQFIEPKPTLRPPPLPNQKPLLEPKHIPPPPSQKAFTESKPTLPGPVTELKPPQSLQPPMDIKLKPAPAPLHPRERQEREPIPQVPQSKKSTTESSYAPKLKSTLREKLAGKPFYDDDDDDDTSNGKQIDLKTGKPEYDAQEIAEKKKWTGGVEDVGKHKAGISENLEKGKVIKDQEEMKQNVSHGVGNHNTGTTMDSSESTQYIVNMVAAVVVLVALWLYTKWTVKTPW